jgi:hypothetical protein
VEGKGLPFFLLGVCVPEYAHATQHQSPGCVSSLKKSISGTAYRTFSLLNKFKLLLQRAQADQCGTKARAGAYQLDRESTHRNYLIKRHMFSMY